MSWCQLTWHANCLHWNVLCMRVSNFITIKDLTIIQIVFLLPFKFFKALLTKSFGLLTIFYYCISLLRLSVIICLQYERLCTNQDLIIVTNFTWATVFGSIVLLCQRNTIATISKCVHVLSKLSVVHILIGWYLFVFIWLHNCFFKYHNSGLVLWSTLYKLLSASS